MKLRFYQENALKKIENAWASGAINVLCQMPTGSGKTILFCEGLRRWQLPTVINAHRLEIVSQISMTLARLQITHRIIGQKALIKEITCLHHQEFNRVFIHNNSQVAVSCVDTLIKLNLDDPIFSQTKLVIQDEAHHVQRDNKWGKCAAMFRNAKGLYVTATPCRADGRGLGRNNDGVIDTLITGPTIQDLISLGYLSPYKIIAPVSNVDLSNVQISATTGDYSLPGLRDAVHKSRIVGDVVDNYVHFAYGLLGITFAVDVQSADDIAQHFRSKNVPAEILTAKTPILLRSSIMKRFRNRDILQLVNVEILGEGVDVPAVEVISMARPTQSFPWYSQMIGRTLRPSAGKDCALVIDHVDNVLRHNLPERPESFWTLERKDKKSRGVKGQIPLTVCKNAECLACYERYKKRCPYCGHQPEPQGRGTPTQVDGNLSEYSEEVMEALRQKIYQIKKINKALPFLKEAMALFMGYCASLGDSKEEAWKRFYFLFDIDILTAQTLKQVNSEKLIEKIIEYLKPFKIEYKSQLEKTDVENS